MSPEERERIKKCFDDVRAQSNANLLRAHKAERDAVVFRALAVSGWFIVIGLALQWGLSA
ncbi:MULTISPECIES: hypothetical protein [Pseudomonas]|uniref:hypothetical protein n=1 Tax=Pseudomonas TaxID=286 RepID=UPI0007DC1ACF|nr:MULTISPECIES: hypothetical protein [Pseudomonas]MCE0965653.1 hypothetical protein [Pseudomonas sp. NMI4491_12]OAS18652.1 hypothetical protein AYO08_05105 [Pseudomonas putida]